MKTYIIRLVCLGNNDVPETRECRQICRNWAEALQLVMDWIEQFGIIVTSVSVIPDPNACVYLIPVKPATTQQP